MNYIHSTKEISEHFGIGKTTIDYWRTSGKVSSKLIGKTYFFDYDEIKNFLNRKNEKSHPKGIYCHICESHTKYSSKKSSNFVTQHLLKIHGINAKQYYDEYVGKEEDKYCQNCGSEKTFISLNKGYKSHCKNPNCYSNDKEVKEKVQRTKLEKYNDAFFVNRTKAKDTNLQKYGTPNFTNRSKAIETMKERYGTSNIMKCEEFKKKSLETKATSKLKLYDQNDNITAIDLEHQRLTFQCSRCSCITTMDTKLVYTRLKRGITLCTNCFPVNDIKIVSYCEKEIIKFIKSHFPEEVIENDRNSIGKELDILIPSKKLAFEYNGIFWHSDEKKEINYHLEKTNKCQEVGIQLIHIFEDEWNNSREIVESKILHLLGISRYKISARNCEVCRVPVKDQIQFYDDNHIQGHARNSYTIGLKYNNEYVAMMSFITGRGKYDLELNRYATKKYHVVRGGASRLLSKFKKENPNKLIVSYADKCWSNGNLYETIGFKKVKESKPSYFYVNPSTLVREHRFKYRKENLKKMGYDIEGKTEKQIISENTNLIRIYNSGYYAYELET
jgi:hypothetical protein